MATWLIILLASVAAAAVIAAVSTIIYKINKKDDNPEKDGKDGKVSKGNAKEKSKTKEKENSKGKGTSKDKGPQVLVNGKAIPRDDRGNFATTLSLSEFSKKVNNVMGQMRNESNNMKHNIDVLQGQVEDKKKRLKQANEDKKVTEKFAKAIDRMNNRVFNQFFNDNSKSTEISEKEPEHTLDAINKAKGKDNGIV